MSSETIQPNKYGVYPDDDAEFITFSAGHGRAKASCEISLLDVCGEWLYSVHSEFYFGDSSSSCGPLTRAHRSQTRNAALLAALDIALHHFHRNPRGGCATDLQVKVSFEMNAKLSSYGSKLILDVSLLPPGTQLGLFETGAIYG